MFWIGLIVGLTVGGTVGILGAALCNITRESDDNDY